jgi:hypothetical protein
VIFDETENCKYLVFCLWQRGFLFTVPAYIAYINVAREMSEFYSVGALPAASFYESLF